MKLRDYQANILSQVATATTNDMVRLDGKALALAHPAIAARFTIEETRRTFRLKDRK